MVNEQSKAGKIYLAIIAITGVFALLGQFYLSIHLRQTSFLEAAIRYFSFFTILTNILVTVCAAVILIKPRSIWGGFFAKASTLTALTVYIVVVGLTYNLLLRGVWDPKGLQKVVDDLLHVIMPALFLLYWIIFVSRNNLQWKVLGWLAYPFIYGVYCIIHGAFTGFYPYFFMDVDKYGYPHIALNLGMLLLFFLALSVALVGISKLLTPKNNPGKLP